MHERHAPFCNNPAEDEEACAVTPHLEFSLQSISSRLLDGGPGDFIAG